MCVCVWIKTRSLRGWFNVVRIRFFLVSRRGWLVEAHALHALRLDILFENRHPFLESISVSFDSEPDLRCSFEDLVRWPGPVCHNPRAETRTLNDYELFPSRSCVEVRALR